MSAYTTDPFSAQLNGIDPTNPSENSCNHIVKCSRSTGEENRGEDDRPNGNEAVLSRTG
jgi:hypothetical protein